MIPYEDVLATKLPDREFTYTERDVILYALGIGYGGGPNYEHELPFVYEQNLRVVPTMTTVMAFSIGWATLIGVDILRFVHGQQKIVMHEPLPPRGTIVAQSRIADVFDKGADKGAIIVVETELRDKDTMRLLCTKSSSSFARGDGGCGGSKAREPRPHPIPTRAPDAVEDAVVAGNQALIYRLSGDSHPLHVDPVFARLAGFPGPILQGLSTLGMACRVVLSKFCEQNPETIERFQARFSAPVFPGETIRFELWEDGDMISFRAWSRQRDIQVLNNGLATLRY
jgi:acyl dehydratase